MRKTQVGNVLFKRVILRLSSWKSLNSLNNRFSASRELIGCAGVEASVECWKLSPVPETAGNAGWRKTGNDRLKTKDKRDEKRKIQYYRREGATTEQHRGQQPLAESEVSVSEAVHLSMLTQKENGKSHNGQIPSIMSQKC